MGAGSGRVSAWSVTDLRMPKSGPAGCPAWPALAPPRPTGVGRRRPILNGCPTRSPSPPTRLFGSACSTPVTLAAELFKIQIQSPPGG